MLGPLAGAVGYGMIGPWREEPHSHSVPLSECLINGRLRSGAGS